MRAAVLRSVIAALLLLTGPVAGASTRLSLPTKAVFLDDTIVVRIEDRFGAALEWEADGFKVNDVGENVVLEPTRTGEVSFCPCTFRDRRGKVVATAGRVTLQVLPPLDDPKSSPEQAVEALARHDRAPVVFRPESDQIKVQVEEPAILSWNMIRKPGRMPYTFTRPTIPRRKGLDIVPNEAFSLESGADLGFEYQREEKFRWTVIASEPGFYEIDPGWTEAIGSSVRRRLPPITLEVVGVAGVTTGMAIGQFNLTCGTTATRNDLWAVDVEVSVKGSGRVKGTLKARGSNVPVAFDLHADPRPHGRDLMVEYHGTFNARVLSVPWKAANVDLPELSYEFWNPVTNAVDSTTCRASRIPIDYKFGKPRAVQDPPPLPPPPGSRKLPYVEIAGLCLSGAAAVALAKTLKP